MLKLNRDNPSSSFYILLFVSLKTVLKRCLLEECHFSRLFFNSTICKPLKKQVKTKGLFFLTVSFWKVYVKNLFLHQKFFLPFNIDCEDRF